MANPQIFISYRRDDAAGYARAVYDELARHFGADRVFMDVDDIGAGQSFADVIDRAVGESRVLLVLIGQRWLGERDGAARRIDAPGDFVAREVATALANGMRVIPLLIDGATMPGEHELPAPLKPLAGRNALELDNTRFAADTERLLGALRGVLPASREAGSAPRGASLGALGWAALVVALATIASIIVWQVVARHGADSASGRPATGAASSVQGRPAIDGAWQADVTYDWPGAHHVERFEFAGDAAELHGSASFLGVARGVLEGAVLPSGLRFVIRTKEMPGGTDVVHRYQARLVGDELHFVMQTEGGASAHVPVEFVARRQPMAGSAPGR